MTTRLERDTMGDMQVPAEALYGASTQRAVINFPISGRRLPEPFLRALAWVKLAAARSNLELGLLSETKAHAIESAAREVVEGKWFEHFPVDVFQTGSATSSHTNMNEVLANLASVRSGEPIGSKRPVHPNDDVNLGQSSNDVVPTALHLSVSVELTRSLVPALETLGRALQAKSSEFDSILKVGRTHLMDATPMTLGQAFSGYAQQVTKGIDRCHRAVAALSELAIGGTAVGTGLNRHPEFPARVCRILSLETGLCFREAANHFEAQGARDDVVEVAGHLATVAGSLSKIANDIRWMGSGPRAGLGELVLPETQPGSSIMPGKVNPVMCEMLVQVCHYSQGLAHTVGLCGRDGQFELNVTLPLIAHALHEMIACLSQAVGVFADRCVSGLKAQEERCRELVDRSLMTVTALNPYIGYDAAAQVAKEAHATGRTLREVVLARGLMDPVTLDRALDPAGMTRPSADAVSTAGG
ncbi:MAG TPA: class II fumarate hydratase [Opitutaceae bacterium]|jgi:fumarate hydratase class II|nr:class II fumarate hydratase [Opitutaceae bacterium]HRE04106.1 class II fumarate hydratase [Opitutaceae bacterium]